MEDLHIAFIQADLIWEDGTANRKKFDDLMDSVSDAADLILLPETFNTGFPVDPKRFAEQIGGPTFCWMAEKAHEKNAVICGTLLLSLENHYYNSLVWMRPDGSFELYHKRHPFSIGGENQLVTAGSEELIVELKGWRIKPMVCYDLRFPVWARNRYHEGRYEYDLLFYLANFPDSRMVVWNTLSIARAIENQACVIAVNRVGEDPNGLSYSGESMAVNARGEVIAKAASYAEVVTECRLDAAALTKFRQKFCLGPDWDDFTIL